MKVMKRFLAMLLCLAMVATLFAGLTLTASAADTYSKATSFAVGDTILFVYESSKVEMSGVSSYGTTTSYSTAPAGAYPLEVVAGKTSGSYAFKTPAGTYLSWSSGNSLATANSVTNASSWTINTSSGGNFKLANVGTTSRLLQYNSGSPRWAAYTSTQTAFQIYKKASTKTLSSIAVSSNHRTFTVGDTFEKETVTATYSDSSTANVTNSATFSGYNMSSAGTQTVTASYSEGGVTKTATYTITVTAPTPHTLTYSVNGDTSVISSGSYTSGSSVSLPANVTAPAGYTFSGWVASAIGTETTTAPTVLPGSYTMPAANTTLYALFTRTEGSTPQTFAQFMSDNTKTSGEFVIAANVGGTYKAMSKTFASKINGTTITVTDGAVASADAGSYKVTIEKNDSKYTISNGSSYLTYSSSTNLGTSSSKYNWSIASGTKGTYRFESTTSGRGLIYRASSYNQFGGYSTGNVTAGGTEYYDVEVLPIGGGTTYYTTTVNTAATYHTLTYSVSPASSGSIDCEIANNGQVEEGTDVTLTATAAEHFTFASWTVTGTEDYVDDGNELLVTMTDDVTVTANFTADPTYTVTLNQVTGGTMTASKLSGIYAGETINLTAAPNTHYSFGGWQCTAGGASISGNSFTMPAANVTITGSFTEAAKYTVTYSVNGDTTVVPAKNDYVGTSYTLPTGVTAPANYTFAGWVESAIGTETTTEPTVLTGNYTMPAANTTLYALFTRTEEVQGGSSDYVKVTSTSDLTDGQYLIVYETGSVALDSSLETIDAVEDTIAVTISNNTIPSNTTTDNSAFTFTASNGSFLGTNGKYIGHSGSKNTLNTSTSAMSNTVSIDTDGNAVINDGGSYVLRYNSISGQDRFRYYTDGQQPIQLYKKASGTTYYTTTVLPPAVSYTLTYSANPAAGGSITCASTSGDSIEEGTSVSLTAAANTHYTFTGWTVNGASAGSNATLNITMDSNMTVVANFTADPTYTVTLNQVTGGTLVANKTADIYAGEAITVTANPAAHYTFEEFNFTGLGGTEWSSDDNVLTFTMPANNVTVTPSFTEDAKYTVTFYASSLQADTGSALSTQSIYDGEYATAPTPDSKDGFTFVGWYTTAGTWSTNPGVTSATVNSTAVTADVTYYGVWAEGGSAASEYTTAPVQTLVANDDTVIIDWALPVTFNVLTNDNINVTVEVTAVNLPSGVVNNGDGSFTFTPSGWQTTVQTFEYTVAGTVNGVLTTDTATVTLKTADSIYYEDTYSGIFTFKNSTGSENEWAPVTDPNLSSIDDIFAYEKDHFVMYSGGTAKQITVEKGDIVTTSGSVSFTFAGTGFDVISATTNNSGAVLMTIKDADNHDVTDPVTHRNLNAIYDNFRGYTYSEVGYTRYTLAQVERGDWDGSTFTANPDGDYYYDRDNDEYKTPDNDKWYDLPEGDTAVYYNIEDAEDSFAEYEATEGTYILKEFTSHWMPYDISGGVAQNYNTNYYQIPVIRVMGLPYGTYNVTLKPFYSSVYDRAGDSSYDFIFDGVRIHNPVADRAAQYKYISIHDAVKAGEGFGSGEVVTCNHQNQEWSDWTFYSKANNTTSATTTNRGSFVQYCSYCHGVANTAYFHVAVTADNTNLGVGGYMGYPANTTLHYTLTADTGDNQAAVQAKLDALTGTLTEYWSSNTGAVMTCTNNSSAVIAKGAGTTYATLQLKDPATQTIYASAIHSPNITVYADAEHTHTFGAWTHVADSDPSTHTHTCTGADCSFYETESCVFTSEVTTQPTQSTPGTKTYTCSGCGYSYEETIPALGGHTATFHVPAGAKAPAAITQTGASITLPAAVAAPASCDAHTYTFAGWVKSAVAYDDTAPAASDILAAGASATLDANTDFYALYTYQVGGSGSSNSYKLITDASTLKANDKLLIVGIKDNAYYAILPYASGNNCKSVIVSDPSNATITLANDSTAAIITLGGSSGAWTLYDGAKYLYAAGGTESNNYLKGADNANATNAQWTISCAADGAATIVCVDNTVVRNTMRFNTNVANNLLFACYASGQNDVYLYRQEAAPATDYYTTDPGHKVVDTGTATDPTCTEAGYTGDVICSECGETVETGIVLDALGHYYEPTETTATGTTYTCTRCDNTYFEADEFEVTYVLQPGVTVSGGSRDVNAITLPIAASIPGTYNAQTYTFVGWADATSADGTTNPTVYEKGEVVNISADTTFYPVYSYGSGGGSSDYVKVTKTSDLTDGQYLIVNEDYEVALDSSLATIDAAKNTIAVTISNNTIPSNTTTENSAFTFTASDGSFKGTNGKYIGHTGTGNTLNTSTTAMSNTVSINSDGNAVIDAGSNYVLRYNNTDSDTALRFRFYAGTQQPIQLYKLVAGTPAVTTYTFELKAAADSYSVTLNPATLTMQPNSTASLTATLYNNGAVVTAEDVSFESDDEDIVVVDNIGGLLSGDNEGTVTVTVEMLAADGEIYTATSTVIVAEQPPVTVNYIGSATGNVKNWGTRGTTASFLTELADNYYTGSYSYDTLSALSGNSGTGTDFYSSALGTAIHNMLVAKQTSTTSYAATTSLYAYTDCIESGNKISSYYSAALIGPNWDSGNTWNREHTWPDSKGLDGSDENDIMMLRPTAVSENSSRGNNAYGEGTGYYDPNKHGQNLRGDVARLMLQHLMRWGNTSKFYGSGGVMESRAILLKWLTEDPVDTWEMGRNDAVQRITGVRNVFVDYPELAFKLLGAEVPANYTTPSKSGIVAAATYSASAGSGYEPVTEGSDSRSIAPVALTEKPATRSIPTGNFNGAVIIDGKGEANTFDDFAAYGPNNEVYLAPGQGIVFSLSSDIAITSQDLQIGAKAVNGTAAAIDVASISNGTESTGIKYLLEGKPIASATEMYYELDTTQMGWNGTESSVLVIYNSGSGVLSVTNLRYSTVNNNTLTMNINEVQTQKAAKMIQIVYGEPITDPDPIEPTDLDLNFKSAELVLNSDIAINFNVDEAVMDSADDVYAVFTKALYNENGEITGYAKETVTEPIFNEETGLYSFRFTGINPAEMGSAVTATLYGYRNGELVEGKTINYSVLTYINNMYGKVNDKDFRALIADLAAYGEAAQNYVSYNTANLVTASVADGLMADATAEAPELNNATAISGDGAVKFTGAYLSLREKVTICYMIDASEYAGDIADLELRIYDGKNLLGKISGADFAADGKYIASFSGLNALQMRTVVTAEVYDGDTCVSNTLDYSIESYAAGKAAGNDALAALVNAMMNFGISAETYFAK